MRKKLELLIREVTPYWAEVLADYLMRNGVVIPVRCKDCASGKGATHKVCPLYKQGLMRDNDFCSYGERKDNERSEN